MLACRILAHQRYGLLYMKKRLSGHIDVGPTSFRRHGHVFRPPGMFLPYSLTDVPLVT